MEDQAIAERIIARFGTQAIEEAAMRVAELVSSGEHVAAEQWQRVLTIIEQFFENNPQISRTSAARPRKKNLQ